MRGSKRLHTTSEVTQTLSMLSLSPYKLHGWMIAHGGSVLFWSVKSIAPNAGCVWRGLVRAGQGVEGGSEERLRGKSNAGWAGARSPRVAPCVPAFAPKLRVAPNVGCVGAACPRVGFAPRLIVAPNAGCAGAASPKTRGLRTALHSQARRCAVAVPARPARRRLNLQPRQSLCAAACGRTSAPGASGVPPPSAL